MLCTWPVRGLCVTDYTGPGQQEPGPHSALLSVPQLAPSWGMGSADFFSLSRFVVPELPRIGEKRAVTSVAKGSQSLMITPAPKSGHLQHKRNSVH